MDTVFKIHGLPKVVVSDRDKIFTSQFWKTLVQGLGIKLHLSSAYHPETNGQTERINQCLETYLRCIFISKPRSWSHWVSLAQWWYNTNYHTAHKRTPFEALFGYLPPIIPAVMQYSPTEIAADLYLKERQEALHTIK